MNALFRPIKNLFFFAFVICLMLVLTGNASAFGKRCNKSESNSKGGLFGFGILGKSKSCSGCDTASQCATGNCSTACSDGNCNSPATATTMRNSAFVTTDDPDKLVQVCENGKCKFVKASTLQASATTPATAITTITDKDGNVWKTDGHLWKVK